MTRLYTKRMSSREKTAETKVRISGRTYSVDVETGNVYRPRCGDEPYGGQHPFADALKDLDGGQNVEHWRQAAIDIHDTMQIAHAIAADVFGGNVPPDLVLDVFDRLHAEALRMAKTGSDDA